MMSKRVLWCVVVVLCVGGWAASGWSKESSAPSSTSVLTADLESAPGLETIVSVVEIPPDTELPKHYHPGEEFIYVLEGSVTLVMEGEADREMTAGDSAKVPLERVHAAKTGSQAAKAVVFRVHKKGEPERIPVE